MTDYRVGKLAKLKEIEATLTEQATAYDEIAKDPEVSLVMADSAAGKAWACRLVIGKVAELRGTP